MELAEIYPAVESAKRAIHLKPDWAEGYQTLGRSMLNTGQLILVSNQNGPHTFDLKISKLLTVDSFLRVTGTFSSNLFLGSKTELNF